MPIGCERASICKPPSTPEVLQLPPLPPSRYRRHSHRSCAATGQNSLRDRGANLARQMRWLALWRQR
jgi:hypothetical protein